MRGLEGEGGHTGGGEIQFLIVKCNQNDKFDRSIIFGVKMVRIKTFLNIFEKSAAVFRDSIATAILIFAILGLFFKSFDQYIARFVSERYGFIGWVYYEVDNNGDPTEMNGKAEEGGALYLLKTGGLKYSDIVAGDKFQAKSAVNFRDKPTAQDGSRTVFVLQTGECVVAIREPMTPVEVTPPKSGGWVRVATSACGLFR